MKIVFRVDASLNIGTGHVMRCLALAEILKNNGAQCFFICREHEGNLIHYIQKEGYKVYCLILIKKTYIEASDSFIKNANWLGASQEQDAMNCLSILEALLPDWLIVDHYALDSKWERILKTSCKKLMVIDDLADRKHFCDLLLDQTFGRDANSYQHLVPKDCFVLCGSEYALLRSEFSIWREYCFKRRKYRTFKNLMITMGGVDKNNVTCQVLHILKDIKLPSELKISVVMGSKAPWLTEVQKLARKMPRETKVFVDVTNMAELMAKHDVAIGAAGSTSWERCCLGLPTILVVLADNQLLIAENLMKDGVSWVTKPDDLKRKISIIFSQINTNLLSFLSDKAFLICDGKGCIKVKNILYNIL